MRLIKSTIHPAINDLSANSFTRKATRAIVLNGENILLLYTKRYHDYSLPGGGIDEGESKIEGLIRELKEETGAHNVTNIREFGLYEEYRPWYKADFDIVHMLSYCFVCDIDDELLEPELEMHELDNGMHPEWVNIHQAIAHNEQTIASSDKKGMSIERETYLLKLIEQELL
ncbi:NUDIX domain-containing protein [Thalassotalea sp. M1531]|uniref:NUDIX domain-containing protein n=1 Tax=Thalassotalea algicola TaxID=2716224 RepID=A0A7Y0LBC7_9GAMM|nr:NUDIX hydrolase [Thalassotalea algicola]NMP31124.1 NUDIX domain-containing protein [Thalassotalea algicola]